MIISEYTRSQSNLSIDLKINQLAKDKADRITRGAMDGIERVRDHLKTARRTYREIMVDNPEFETFFKKQIDELTQIIERVGKQVGDLVVKN